jgi:hypothetical protein
VAGDRSAIRDIEWMLSVIQLIRDLNKMRFNALKKVI